LDNHKGYGGQVWIDTNRYGTLTGAPPRVINGNVGAMQRVFSVGVGKGAFNVEGLYVESALSLGSIGASIAGAPSCAVINGLEASLYTPSSDADHELAPAPDYHFANFMPTIFNGGQLSCRTPGGAESNELMRVYNQMPLRFTGTDFANWVGVGSTANNLPISFHRPDLARMVDCKVTDGVTGSANRKSEAITQPAAAVGTAEVSHVVGAKAEFTLSGHGCAVGDVIQANAGIAGWKPKFLPANTVYSADMAIGRVFAVDGDTVTLTGVPENLISLLPESYTLTRRTIAFG
jgi:hypothetical protein